MDYANLLAVARNLIDSTGRTVSLEKLLALPKDEAKPWRGTADDGQTVETASDKRATFVPHTGNDMGSLISDKELLKSVEKVCLIAGDEEQLDKFNCIVDGGDRWKVEWCQVLQPGDTVMLYVFGVCR